MVRDFDRLVDLVRKHPGLNGLQLKAVGWRPSYHGSLQDAERADLIESRGGGWYVVPICAPPRAVREGKES
jgi:hypothetical protein